MKKHYFLLFFFSLLTILALISCNPMILNKTGKATISITNRIENSSIYSKERSKSPIDLSITEYRITATGPFGSKIKKNIDANETVSFASMVVGNWNIKVKAIADENIVVGEGSTSITIEENKENLVNIDIHEKEGKGKLVVSIGYNASTLTEIKVTPKESTANTVTEKLLKK